MCFSAIVTLLAGAWVEMTSAGILTAARYVAARYAGVALERAQNDLAEAIAGQIAAGLRDGPFVAPPAGERVAAGAFFVATHVALDGLSGAPDTSANVTARNVQRNAGVSEHRLAATLDVTVSNAAGAILARAERRVTVRTFAAWPYVTLAGADEATVDGYAVGDFAGSCDGSETCGGVDNRIHAVARCVDVAQPERCAGQPYLPVDAFENQAWRDLSADARPWSR